MKKILVPIDFSQHSRAALEMACDLARRNSATVTVLHIIENPKTSILLPDLYLKSIPDNKNFNERLTILAREKVAEWIPEKDKDIELSSEIAFGNLFDEFRKLTETSKPDLIVIGTKGYNDKNINTIGSFTERVMKKSDSPVLAVKAGFHKEKFHKIMVVADFIENEATVAFEVKRLQKLFNAHVEIVRINTPQDFESDHYMESKFKILREKYRLENCTLLTYNHSYKEEGIILAAKKSKADLIAIAIQSKSFLERFFPIRNENSIEDDFIDHLEYPIWIFKPYFKLPVEPKIVEEIRSFKFF